MPPTRSYRKLLLSLAVIMLSLDLGSKYGMFTWLYHGGQPAKEGVFETWTEAKTWRDGTPTYVMGGRYNLVPGWFGFTAEYRPTSVPSGSGLLKTLQTVSAPVLPRVNHGALFGLGNDHEERANAIFAGVSLIAAVAILIWGLKKANASDRWLCISLGLILGGTLGNFFDRIVFRGVRDFLYFYKIEWPVFNIADCGLVIGAAMLLAQALFAPKKATTSEPSVVAVPSVPAVAR